MGSNLKYLVTKAIRYIQNINNEGYIFFHPNHTYYFLLTTQ